MHSASNAWQLRFTLPGRNPRHLTIWLCIVCVLIYSIILIGGYTRLTESGLSIVDWKPISGVIPPLTHTQWIEEFQLYQQYPEFSVVHPDMNLDGFKKIFFVEYFHRLVGRVIALVFFIPFVYFWLRGYLKTALAARLSAVFLLGALQGLLGWYMVKSGLVDNPSVSQYRLTAHLSLAVVLYAYVLWLTVSSLGWCAPSNQAREYRRMRAVCLWCLVMAALMQVSGGFMAGTHAGFIMNTFPDMNGVWLPQQLLSLSPVWRNVFENVITIQFLHRWLALGAVLSVGILWIYRFRIRERRNKLMLDACLAAALLQASLGVMTLLSAVQLNLAIAHQAGFVLLLSALVIAYRVASPVHYASNA